MTAKFVVVGLDGATFTLLEPWIDAGFLPHLKDIMDNGVTGTLMSSIPPMTSPAFPCFITGKNPGKHGVVWFLGKRRGTYEEISLDSTSIDSKFFWEILSEDGKKVAVLNVPATYPIQPVNGVMISGFLTPPGKRDFAHPPGLLDELEERFGPYEVDLKTPAFLLANQTPAAIEQILHEARESLDYKFSVAHYIMEKDEYDLFVLHIVETDRLQHWLWNLLDASHPHYEKHLAEKYSPQILEYYRALDSAIGALAAKTGPATTLIIMSDHGFGPCHGSIDLNAWLLQEGYLKIKDRPISQLKFFLWKAGWNPAIVAGLATRLLKLKSMQQLLGRVRGRNDQGTSRLKIKHVLAPVFLSMSDIDWSRSRAYCLSGYGQIRFNLNGREPQGIVKPGEEYETLRDEIIEKLKGLTHPKTGKKVNGLVFAKEDIYSGKHADELPDITFLPEESSYNPGTPITFISPRVFSDDIPVKGFHRMEGILIVRGPNIRMGVSIRGAHIMDLAPTILYMAGSKVPSDMDGIVLTEIFRESFLRSHAVSYSDEVITEGREGRAMSPEDHEAVVERLKSLGYID